MKKILVLITFLIGFQSIVLAQPFCSGYFSNIIGYSSKSPDYSPLQDCYDVVFYDLSIEASDTTTFIKGYSGLSFITLSSLDSLAFELKQSISIDSVYLNGNLTDNYIHDNNLLMIFPETTLPAQELNSIMVRYRGGQSQEGFFTGLTSRRDFFYQVPVTYTLSEPFQSSTWFPVKQNLADKADSVRVVITTDSSLMAGSNGLLTGMEMMENGKTRYTWESDYPIAYYLISIAVADYIDYSFYVSPDGRDDSLLIQNFIYDHPDIFANEKERIDDTGDMMILYSDLFGEYPFYNEKYGHSMAPMGGGMEHQTMTTLQSFNFDLVAHELVHQWFGDNVTCATWQDIWVNEGFASYGEYLAREYLLGLEQAISWMENAHDIAKNSQNGSVYLQEEESRVVNRIFSYSLSYKKGAAILHMLRHEINDDDLFFKAFRDFQIQYADSVATGADFLATVNDVTGEDYSWFFDQWYYGEGFPVVQTTWKKRADSLYLEVYQGGSSLDAGIFRMHMDFLIDFSDGSDTLIRVLLNEPANRFSFYLPKKMTNIQMDPLQKILMIDSLYEYIPNDESVEINPNPFTRLLYLDFSNQNSNKSVMITNMNGQVILNSDLGSVSSAELDLSELSAGLYLLVVRDGDKKNALRIVKQ